VCVGVCLVGEVHALGPAVSTDAGSEVFALSAAAIDSLLHVQLPASVCSLFVAEAQCHQYHSCVFCAHADADALNQSFCYAFDDVLPAGYDSVFSYWQLTLTATDLPTTTVRTAQDCSFNRYACSQGQSGHDPLKIF